MRVKICGIRNMDEGKKISLLKPDAIGILVGYNKKIAPNVISEKKAREIIRNIPEKIDTFLLTDKTNVKTITSYCKRIGNKYLQLTGDIDIEEIGKIKSRIPGIKIVKVIHINGEKSIEFSQLYEKCNYVDELLLDSRTGNKTGGTGIVHEWNISRRIVRQSRKPVWLAGGLKISNLKEAIRTVKPYGVDVETGVQNPDGSKNYYSINEFISIAKSF